MKKICLLLSLILFVTCFTACEKEEPPEQINVEPKVEQMHAICEMATMKCYYHNVAKYFEKDAEGFGWWKKDRKFWVEYDGVVILGVEVNEIEMKIEGNTVYITECKPKIIDAVVGENSLNEDSFYVDAKSAEIKSEHEQKAIKEAQAKMKESAENNKALLNNAKQRAQSLLEDYVQNVGSAVGKQYEVKWVDSIEKNPSTTSTINETTAVS